MEKFDQLKLFLWNRSRPQVDVFALNETFLKPEVPDSLYFIPGFTLYRRDRVGSRKGGGVMVYVNDELNFKRRTDLENSELGVIWLEVCPYKSKRPILFGTIYRPPSYNKDMNLKLQRNLEAVYPLNKETILIGDFNLHYFKTASKRNILMKALSGMEFKQLINRVTRPISGTCLDHIFSNRPERITNVKTFESGLADHFPVLAVRLYKAKFCSRLKNKLVTINYRSMKFFDANRFVETLGSLPWETIFIFEDVEDMLSAWETLFNQALDAHCPWREKRVSREKQTPCMTKAIIERLRLRDMLLKIARRSNAKADWDSYKLARNKCVNIIKHEKRAFYSNCFEENKGNSKAMWKTIKSLMSTKKSDVCMNLGDHSNEHEAETFNDYFTSIDASARPPIIHNLHQ